MSKNTEILVELLNDERVKFEKLVAEQAKLTIDFSEEISRAKTLEINTQRLEEVIGLWNDLFTKQKLQITELQKNQIKENKKHRVITYLILSLIISILIIKHI